MTSSLPQNQLRYKLLRREIFVARKNVEKLLKSMDPVKWELNGWSKKSIEAVLNEILSAKK
jgi:hypothetical protein